MSLKKRLPPVARPKAEHRAILEIQRVAHALDAASLSKSEFERYSQSGSVTGITYLFGSWNAAVEAAGLVPNSATAGSKRRLTDRDLLEEILRVQRELGREPSERLFTRHALVSVKPYRERWGTFTKAVLAARDIAASRND